MLGIICVQFIVAMLLVVVYIVQPFDADIHAGLVGEIPESDHVIAIGFVAEIFAINHPVCVLFMTLRMQLQLGIEEHITIGWGEEIAAWGIEGLLANADGFNHQSGVRPAFVDLEAAFRTGE